MRLKMWVAFLGLGFAGCWPPSIPEPALEGWEMFESTRSFDEPGTILRVNPDNTILRATVLKVKKHEASETLPVRKSTLTLEALFKVMGVQLPIGLNAQSKSTLTIGFSAEECTREYVFDDEVDPQLTEAIKKLGWHKDSKYYLIRETVKAGKVNYKFENSFNSGIGANADFKKAVEANASLKRGGETFSELIQTFKSPQRILFKREVIEPRVASLTGEQPETFLWRPVPRNTPLWIEWK